MSVDRWEARIYNQSVRDAFSDVGYNNTSFGDKWADAHYIVVFASSRKEAERLFSVQFPSSKGFVVRDIVNLDRPES